MSKRVQTACTFVLSIVCAATAVAADPEYYTRKDTWQETLRASREALAVYEAEAALKAELAAVAEPKLTAKVGRLQMTPFFQIGPFSENGKDALITAFPPESEIKLTQTYGQLRWRPVTDPDGAVYTLKMPNNSAMYFYRKVQSSQAAKWTAYFSSGDALTVWFNGEQVFSAKAERGGAKANQHKVELAVAKGENNLLIKISSATGPSGWYFSPNGKEAAKRRGKAPPDPRLVAREGLWKLIGRDFTSAEARRQTEWEKNDRIWLADWPEGNIATLAKRYATPLRGTPAGTEAAELIKAAKTAADLAKVRAVYYRGKLRNETLAKLGEINIPAVRRAVGDLIETFGEKYPKGAEYLRRLDAMEKALAAASSASATTDRQTDAVAEFLALRREALLANPLLDFEKLLVVKRGLRSPKLGLPQNWQGNCALSRSGYDDQIALVDMKDLTGELKTLYKPEGSQFVGDVDLHFDGTRMLFSSLDHNNRWQIYEIGADGKGLTQVTPSDDVNKDVDNYDAVYLPDGRIIFGSTRCFLGVPCVGGNNSVANLYLMNADRDPKTVRQITFEQDHDWCPTVMHDGRIMYARWEYSDAPHYFSRLMLSMNPDGTGQGELYGSNSYWPNSTFYSRPTPGHPTKFVGVISGHHGVPRQGELIVFDPARSHFEADGVVQRIPGYGQPVEPKIADGLVNGSWPRFLHPWPLSDKYILVSCQKSAKHTWDLYLVDTFDNMVLLRKEPGYAMFEPIPLAPSPTPPAIPDKVDPSRKDAIVYMANIYEGPGLKGVPRGTVKKLRLYSFHYAYYKMGGHINIGIDGPWDVHRILGTVPVSEDGSAMFRVPANTPLAVQPLDAEGKAMQTMRSWMTAMPGEFLSCVGCHEKQHDVAAMKYHEALTREPDEIEPFYGPARGFGFEREVQPVLDKYCVGCHDGEPKEGGKTIPDFRRSDKKGHRNFTMSYLALHPYVRRPGPESDYHMSSPLEYHANGSELVQMLEKGHGRVKLDRESWDRLITWIDLNVPDKGTWSEYRGIAGNYHQRRTEMSKLYAGLAEDPEAISQGDAEPVGPVKPGPKPATPAKVTLSGWPFDAAEAKQRQQAAGEKTEMSVELAEGVKLDLVLIPAGKFVMGDVDGWTDEWQQAVVTIDKPFWMGKLEVTNQQFASVDPTHDSKYISNYNKDQGNRGVAANGPTQPVIRVTWKQAMAFCEAIGRKTGLKFSLPTEAQWEYACRAGTDTAMSYGPADADFGKLANFADKSLVGLCRRDSPKWIPIDANVSDGMIIAGNVGTFAANAWGLHDMHGNVSEWTRSAYKPYPYNPADGRDAIAAEGSKVVRGGSFYDRPKRGRSGFRLNYPAWRGVFNVGFRVVCEAAPNTLAARPGK